MRLQVPNLSSRQYYANFDAHFEATRTTTTEVKKITKQDDRAKVFEVYRWIDRLDTIMLIRRLNGALLSF